jgi:hypothetical protein
MSTAAGGVVTCWLSDASHTTDAGLPTFLPFVVRTVFFGVCFLRTVTFHMLRTCFSQSSTMGALRDRPSFLIDMDEGSIWRSRVSKQVTLATTADRSKRPVTVAVRERLRLMEGRHGKKWTSHGT